MKIFSYNIEYSTDNEWNHAGTSNKAADTHFLFTSAQPGVTYSFRVYANGLLAYSVPSAIVSYTVPEGKGGKFINFSH